MKKLLIVPDIFNYPATHDTLFQRMVQGQSYCYMPLAELSDGVGLKGEDLHRHLFDKGGIDIAWRRLNVLSERGWIGVGFSAGGTVLWKAAVDSVLLSALVCISSTRLRFETAGLSIPSQLYWGELDSNRPSSDWHETYSDAHTVFSGAGHDFYKTHAPFEHILAERIAGF